MVEEGCGVCGRRCGWLGRREGAVAGRDGAWERAEEREVGRGEGRGGEREGGEGAWERAAGRRERRCVEVWEEVGGWVVG